MGRIQRRSSAVLDKDLKVSEELPGRREGHVLRCLEEAHSQQRKQQVQRP